MVIRNTSPHSHFLPYHRPTVIARIEEVKAMKNVSKLHIVEIVTQWSFKDRQQSFENIDPSESAYALKMSDEKIGQIKEYPFEVFCERNFRTVFSWGSKVPITEIMSFNASMIDNTLIKMSKHLRETAKILFKCILTYMGERPSSKPTSHYVTKALKVVLTANSDIADEFYCQIIKQTNNNPDLSSALKAWTFCGIISGIVSPSQKLRLHLLNHMLTVIENESQEVSQRAIFSASRLEEIYNNGTRLTLPSDTEIKHLEHMKPYPIAVYFKNGSCVSMLIESYSNASEVKRKLLKQLNIPIPKMIFFGLFEIFQHEDYFDERLIEEEELIMDVITVGEGFNRIILQYKVFPPFYPTEPETVSFYYLQLSFDVLVGRIPVVIEQAVILAALMLQVDKGDFIDEASLGSIDLQNYIPQDLLLRKDLVSRVYKSYKDLVTTETREAKQRYIEILRDNVFFATTSFKVVFMKITGGARISLPGLLTLAINAKGVYMHSANKERKIMHFPYSRVVSWGISRNILMLSAIHDHCQVSIYFNTTQARLIHSLADAYALLSVNGTLKQISQSTCTRKEGLNREQAFREIGKAIRLYEEK
mmetsp:Transcript_2007/g.4520  ORF Transcript_2007/g.4520 Transcript_2007/m.4520 type:complete len:591 (-) Transcript_2007:174-1946(-)